MAPTWPPAASLPVALTTYGDRWLRAHHDIALSATATGRDLLTNTTTATTTGVLR